MNLSPDPRNTPPSSQNDSVEGGGGEVDERGAVDWLRRATQAYNQSTSYVDSNFRKQWDDGIRAFNNQHANDSKYNAPAYDKRSKLFRPKTRSVIRKTEAAAAAAFFSNMEVVSIQATDQSDPVQRASAEVMAQLLQYRLTKTIPWFQTVLGGLQDSQVTGAACAHVHWVYDAARDPIIDKPVIDLIPIENVRFDPAASWLDPVNTSPYFIELIPMWAMDIQAKMDSGEWKQVPLRPGSTNQGTSSTRNARVNGHEDPTDQTRPANDYELFWVQRHIHRNGTQDMTFYTLGTLALLSEPIPLKQIVFHGRRPYVIGNAILETHKSIPSGVPQISKGLQDEANEIANQRIDNVKFALNKKWFAKRGVDVDLPGLVRNVPGGIVMMNDPINDVREITWPDVTASAYEEQNRINVDMDELLGNFNPAGLMAQNGLQAPARNMALLNQSNGTLVEYLLKTYVETFVQPVLRLLILTEQQYETDRVILGIAAKQSKMLQRAGIDQVTDELLMQEVTLTVNVGMGATDPQQKLQKFMTAMTSYTGMLQHPTPGINMIEVGKEIFGHLGYQDGSRFFSNDNPQIAAMAQTITMLKQQMGQLEMQLKEKNSATQAGVIKTQIQAKSKLDAEELKQKGEDRRALSMHMLEVMHLPPEPKKEPSGSGKSRAKT